MRKASRKRRSLFLFGFVAIAGGLAVASPAFAAWLESSEPAPRRTWNPPPPTPWVPPPTPWIVPPPPPPPPPTTGAAATVHDLLSRVSLGTPEGYGALTIVPILSPRAGASTAMLSMDAAVASGRLRVYESGSGSVPSVTVENVGASPVFLLAGEIVLGGRQDRLIREDTVIGAYSGPVSVPVYCVEQGRWNDGVSFKSAPEAIADASLRAKASSAAGQEAVWSHVAARAEAAGVQSPTSAYRAFEQSPAVARALDEYVRACPRPRPWRGHVVGAVFVSGGSVLGIDLFEDPGMLASLWPKLIRSYAAQVYASGVRWRSDTGAARVALSALQSAWPRESGWAGSAARVTLDGAGYDASAVVVGATVVHLGAFPGRSIDIEPPPPPPPPPPTPWYPWYPLPNE